MLGMHALGNRQFAHGKDEQAEKGTQHQQAGKCAICRLDAQHEIPVKDECCQKTEEDREHHQQQKRQCSPTHVPGLKLADHMQRAHVGNLGNRQQTKDQRGCKADGHAAENNLEVQLEEDVEAKVLHQTADDITHTYGGGGTDYPADQSEQTGLQTEEQVEISALIA